MSSIFEENFFEEEGDLLEVIQEPTNDHEEETQNLNDRGDESPKEDEEDGKRIIKPKSRVSRPRLKLDAARLVGPRGIGVLESTFCNIKLKGKGHELDDLNKVLRTLEHWAHRLYPKMSFDDCIDKIEDLGSKRNVMVHVTKIRLGMEDIEPPPGYSEIIQEEIDPFDELIRNNTETSQPPSLTEEQRARMLRNRLIAEEIRLKKLQARQQAKNASVNSQDTLEVDTANVDIPSAENNVCSPKNNSEINDITTESIPEAASG